MKYQILGLLIIKESTPEYIAKLLSKPIAQVKAALQELENEGQIKKVYVGLESRYKAV